MNGILRTGSSRHATELVRLGWTVEYQFFWGDDAEPYEIGLQWDDEDEPLRADQNADEWLTPEGVYRLKSEREQRHNHKLR
ncbi:MAG: hypothetical protein JNL35_04935 [Sphingopyxis sp.]|nr:hypothetical protein [Sphingopyxis sp.]